MYDDSTAFTPDGDLLRWITIDGDGDPVVFVHGLGCHGAGSWADAAARLGRRAVILDLPGHGRSDRPRNYGYSLHDLADAVARVIGAVSEVGVDLVSHSLGGSVAILLAAEHPELVHRSVIVEPAIDRHEIRPSDIGAWSEEDLLGEGWERLLDREMPWRRADVRLTDPIALRRCARHTADALGDRLGDLLASSPVPTTLIRGGRRSYSRQGDFEAGGVIDVLLPDAGHFVMLDDPEEFERRLRSALPPIAPPALFAAPTPTETKTSR